MRTLLSCRVEVLRCICGDTALVDALLSFGVFELSDCHQPGSFGRPQSSGTSEGLGVSTTKAKQRPLKVNFVQSS